MSRPKIPTASPVSRNSGEPVTRIAPADESSASAAHSATALQWLSALHERQRQEVAAALHNQIGQAVSAIKMSAHLVLDEVDAMQRREDLLDIIRMADDTVAQLRQLHCQLRPPQLDALGLEAALRGEVERRTDGFSEIRLDLATLPSRPAPEVELACLRIAQQVLTHALAGADGPLRNPGLHLALRDLGATLCMRLRIDAGEHQVIAAIGESELESLCEYAAAMGGSLHAETAGGSCLVVELRLPSTAGTSLRTDHGHGHACNRGRREP